MSARIKQPTVEFAMVINAAFDRPLGFEIKFNDRHALSRFRRDAYAMRAWLKKNQPASELTNRVNALEFSATDDNKLLIRRLGTGIAEALASASFTDDEQEQAKRSLNEILQAVGVNDEQDTAPAGVPTAPTNRPAPGEVDVADVDQTDALSNLGYGTEDS